MESLPFIPECVVLVKKGRMAMGMPAYVDLRKHGILK